MTEDQEIVYRQAYRFGEVPKWVVTNEGGAARIDTLAGRYWLKPGDVIAYTIDWTPVDVYRRPSVGRPQ